MSDDFFNQVAGQQPDAGRGAEQEQRQTPPEPQYDESYGEDGQQPQSSFSLPSYQQPAQQGPPVPAIPDPREYASAVQQELMRADQERQATQQVVEQSKILLADMENAAALGDMVAYSRGAVEHARLFYGQIYGALQQTTSVLGQQIQALRAELDAEREAVRQREDLETELFETERRRPGIEDEWHAAFGAVVRAYRGDEASATRYFAALYNAARSKGVNPWEFAIDVCKLNGLIGAQQQPAAPAQQRQRMPAPPPNLGGAPRTPVPQRQEPSVQNPFAAMIAALPVAPNQ